MKKEIKNDNLNKVVSKENEEKVTNVVSKEISNTGISITNAAAVKKQIAKEQKEKRELEIISFINTNDDIKINFMSKEDTKKNIVKKLNGNKKDVKNAMKKEFISFENCKESTLHILNTLNQRGEINLLISLKQVKYLFNNKDFQGLCHPTKSGKYTMNILIDNLFLVYKIKAIK